MPACAGATPSAAPLAVRAGRLMSMPNDGRATRRLNSNRFQSFGRPVSRHPESLPLVPAATLGWPSRQPRCRNH
jgi:hypothetical protein